jgi:Protein of unknown function (DUF3224)
MPQAKGEFEIKREMQPDCDLGDDVTAMHVRFDKRFHGSLDATSTVQMLGFMTATEGSGAYVAIERIVGTLDGRAGSFVMQHNGTMNRGERSLSVTVVPDSATGDLAGLRGALAIDIVDGRHFYTFDYEFAA